MLEGQCVGEFQILERLGQGGMGAVYKARQVSLDRFVALKTLHAALAADPEFIARFHREAKAAAALNHPNLVQVYSAGETGGLHWFAMEFVEGESAEARLKREGRIEPAEAVAIAVHVATALEHGWRRAQLIHRDIKPDNIFLASEGDVKLGDLGLAKSAGEHQSLTMTGASIGTPHYISPEQAEGKGTVDLRADIYSLGCTLFHLLSGKTPYSADTAMSVMLMHVTAPVPDLRSVRPACPEELARVVAKMMHKQPAGRQQSYAEVIADLRRACAALDGATVPKVTDATQSSGQSQPVALRNRTPVAALAVGGIALLAGVAVLFHFAPWKKGGAIPGGTRPAALQTPAGDGGKKAGGDSAPPSKAGATIANATQNAPFVNSLGMKFVPVPVAGGQRVLFSIWETRVHDYAEFARTNHVDDSWMKQEKDGVPVSRDPEHPVCGVNWAEANAFCKWLTGKESADGKLPGGSSYRLPTDAEWSRAAERTVEKGATLRQRSEKNVTEFPWGTAFPPTNVKVGNYADTAWHEKFPNEKWIEGYTDGFATTAPVGSFAPNRYGIHDLGGNVWEWCEDVYEPGGAARVLRGGSWTTSERSHLLSANRYPVPPAHRDSSFGFRVVISVGTTPP